MIGIRAARNAGNTPPATPIRTASGGFPGVVTGTRDRSFGSALGQAFTNDYPAWSLGVTVSYPLGQSYEAANVARAEVERQQTSQRMASLRLQAAEAVRRAARQARSTAERVDAARAGATFAEQRFQAEQRRFEVGRSTTFLVTQAQCDLLQAQVNLLQTISRRSSISRRCSMRRRSPTVIPSASEAPTSSCCRRPLRAACFVQEPAGDSEQREL